MKQLQHFITTFYLFLKETFLIHRWDMRCRNKTEKTMSGPDFPFHTIVVSLIGSKEWWDAPLTPSGCSSHINEPLRANVSLNGLLNY